MATTHATRRKAATTPPTTAERPIMSATQVRDNFADVVNRVSYGGERILVGRRGNARRAIAMVPAEDLKLLEDIEDRIDLRAARAALKEDTVSWDDLKSKLGL